MAYYTSQVKPVELVKHDREQPLYFSCLLGWTVTHIHISLMILVLLQIFKFLSFNSLSLPASDVFILHKQYFFSHYAIEI